MSDLEQRRTEAEKTRFQIEKEMELTRHLWLLLLGGALVSPECREKTIKTMGRTVAPQELMGLWYAIKKEDGEDVWREMSQFQVGRRKQETVIEAIAEKLTTAGAKAEIKALTQRIMALVKGGDYHSAGEHAGALCDCIKGLG